MDTSIKDYNKALIGLIGAFFIVLFVSYKGCSQMGISIDSTGISIGAMDPLQIIYVRNKKLYAGPQLNNDYNPLPGMMIHGVAGCDCTMRIDSVSTIIKFSGLQQKRVYLTEL